MYLMQYSGNILIAGTTKGQPIGDKNLHFLQQ